MREMFMFGFESSSTVRRKKTVWDLKAQTERGFQWIDKKILSALVFIYDPTSELTL